MPTVLILSSHVAASRVGGGAQAAALARMGVETILAPTVLFGRHPGLGAPGGGPVSADLFESMAEGIEASGALANVDAVITGYFADARQVRTAARLIDAVRGNRPDAWIVVDPIMGDRPGGRYVAEDAAEELTHELVPRADLIAPNAWELEQLSTQPISTASSALAAARSLGRATLVSSIDEGEAMGVLYADTKEAWLASHPRQVGDPKGAGDLLTALFVGATLSGATPRGALQAAVSQVAARVLDRRATVRTRAV